MLILFFGAVLLFIILFFVVLTKCNENQLNTFIKWCSIFFLLAFMIETESARVNQAEKIETLQSQINQMTTIIGELDAQGKKLEAYCSKPHLRLW